MSRAAKNRMIFCLRMSRARIPVVWIGLLALPLSIWGRRLPVQTFTVAEGLPRNATSCLAPGPTGVMWICSSEGLIRYDGSGFRVFGQESGLPATAVSNAIPARSGGYWIVTSRGVCRLEKTSRIGEPCRVIPGSAPGNTPIADVFESATGKTWFATDGRVSEIQQTSSGRPDAAFHHFPRARPRAHRESRRRGGWRPVRRHQRRVVRISRAFRTAPDSPAGQSRLGVRRYSSTAGRLGLAGDDRRTGSAASGREAGVAYRGPHA